MNTRSKITSKKVLKVTSMSIALSVLLSSFPVVPVSHAAAASKSQSNSAALAVLDAPKLIPDQTTNVLGQSINITFADDAQWRGAITDVQVNGMVVSPSKYTITPGHLTFSASVFKEGFTQFVVVHAKGYDTTVVYQDILPKTDPDVPTNPQPHLDAPKLIADSTMNRVQTYYRNRV